MQTEADIKAGQFVVWTGAPDQFEEFDSIEAAEAFIKFSNLKTRDYQVTWNDDDKAICGWFDCVKR